MVRTRTWLVVALLGLALCGTPPRAWAQDTVFKRLSPEQIESIMQGVGLTSKKVTGKNPGVFYYDFTRDNKILRLHFFNGQDIMIDVLFDRFPLEVLNNWNKQAKFSRASLHKDAKGEFVALESNLDILGGVTENTVKQFFNTFFEEIRSFEKHLGAGNTTPPTTPTPPNPNPNPPPTPVAGGDEVIKNVGTDRLEKVLASLNITYKKNPLKGGGNYYDFDFKSSKMRLYNWNGQDLMIDSVFKKSNLDTVNKYNLNRKFIRAVLYGDAGNEYTSLECNIDCAAGITDNILRHFIVTFDEEVKAFTKFLGPN